MSGKELVERGYPRKSPGKRYMTFSIDEITDKEALRLQTLDIKEILAELPDHKNGVPVFLEPSSLRKAEDSEK